MSSIYTLSYSTISLSLHIPQLLLQICGLFCTHVKAGSRLPVLSCEAAHITIQLFIHPRLQYSSASAVV